MPWDHPNFTGSNAAFDAWSRTAKQIDDALTRGWVDLNANGTFESDEVAWDVDNDGLTEVVAQSFDQKIYCWDTPWTFNQSKAVWPMFKRNQRNTGAWDDDILAVTAVPDERPELRPLVLQNAPNPFFASTLIRYRVPEGEAFRGVRLSIFDLNGRLVRTLVDGEQLALHPLRSLRVGDERDRAAENRALRGAA